MIIHPLHQNGPPSRLGNSLGSPAGRLVSYAVRVRHEVADVAVLKHLDKC